MGADRVFFLAVRSFLRQYRAMSAAWEALLGGLGRHFGHLGGVERLGGNWSPFLQKPDQTPFDGSSFHFVQRGHGASLNSNNPTCQMRTSICVGHKHGYLLEVVSHRCSLEPF